MTDPIVIDTESALTVLVDTGTPVTTITDNTTGSVAVIDTKPIVATIVDERPIVTVYTGSGPVMSIKGDKGDPGVGLVGADGTTGADGADGLELLPGAIPITLLDVGLQDDLTQLHELWTTIGDDILLTYPDGVELMDAGRVITNQSIVDAVYTLSVSVDGKIDLTESLISQTAEEILQTVTNYQQVTDGTFEAHNSLISQNAFDIGLQVTSISDMGEDVSIAKGEILVNANRITLGVERQDTTDGNVTIAESRITLTEDTIDLAVSTLDGLTGRMEDAEVTIASNAVTMSVSSAYLNQKLTAVQTLLDNQWGLTIEETVGGDSYVAGVSLLLHPTWVEGVGYNIGDSVYFEDNAYDCIEANLADSGNIPPNIVYWTLIPGGAKSVFAVSAEEFHVVGPNGSEPLFTVDTNTGSVNINGTLVVGMAKSTDWDSGVGPGFLLNPTTGVASFRDMVMTFSSVDALDDVQTGLGIPDTLVFAWNGEDAIRENTDFDGAQEWLFDSDYYSDGATIQIVVDDDFTGELEIVLNGVSLKLDAFGDHDFGDYDASSAFSNESSLDAVIDLSVAGNDADLGGF